jgi:hypothetical protein
MPLLAEGGHRMVQMAVVEREIVPPGNIDGKRVNWAGIPIPDEWCGYGWQELNNSGARHHTCNLEPGHKGNHKCVSCDIEY